jgi:hypothetical protein
MQSSDTRKIGFLVSGVLLGLLVNLLANGFGASRPVSLAFSTVPVLGGVALGLLSPGPAKPQLSETQRRQRNRSIAIAIMLAGFCVLFYIATFVRMGGQMIAK